MSNNSSDFYDIIVVGGGPAGLSAAIYSARARYRVLVIEKEAFGGKLTITSEVLNYPGILHITGPNFSEELRKQAISFGAKTTEAEVLSFDVSGDMKVIHTNKGDYKALGIIIATGANPKSVGFKGEKEFRGKGVSYNASADGNLFKDLEVFVVGAGFSALEEAVFLTSYAKKVNLIVRKDVFRADGGDIIENILNNEKIQVHFNTEVFEVGGNDALEYVKFINNKTKETWEYKAPNGSTFGIFVFAGYVPSTELFKSIIDVLEFDDKGYIITDKEQKTSVDGIYAAGDICIKNLRQVVTAVSDGAIAATAIKKHISNMYTKLNLKREMLKLDK